MKAKTSLGIRFGIALFIFIVISTPFILLPRIFHFKVLYPVFNFLFLHAAKIRSYNLTNVFFKPDKPVIFASNHKSFADFSIIVKYIKKPFTIVIKKEMLDNIFFRFLAFKMMLLPVKRGDLSSQVNVLKKASRIIKNRKYSVVIFPEGYYIPGKIIGEIKNGIAKLACETGAAVVPVAIYGIDNNFIEEKKLVWKDVYIKAGEPVNFLQYNDTKKFLDEVKIRIENLYNEISSMEILRLKKII